MSLFAKLSPLQNVIDALILVVLLFPILYYLVFRPLTVLGEQQKNMALELLKHQQNLDELVAQRTLQINNLLELHEQEDVHASDVINHYLNTNNSDPRVEYSILSASQYFSGDAISIVSTPDGGINIMMLDAMGHGLSAAINALPVTQAFYSMSHKGLPLKNIISEINDKTYALATQSRFLATTFLHLDQAAEKLTGWIGGTPKIYLKNGEDIVYFRSANLPLGVLPSRELEFEYFSAPWAADSLLLTCTDGVIESEGHNGENLGEKWVFETIQKYGNSLDVATFDRLWKESSENEALRDDATVLIINEAKGRCTLGSVAS